ncbi:MAG: hypothetical protein KIT72_06130 [Polyangiaceae bacterium]|nr:hypothetical protein [Polyangiaceae bacterium]MCW5789978.1 hypothetical protein [Polyangiaceae bacterium]
MTNPYLAPEVPSQDPQGRPPGDIWAVVILLVGFGGIMLCQALGPVAWVMGILYKRRCLRAGAKPNVVATIGRILGIIATVGLMLGFITAMAVYVTARINQGSP